MEKRKVYQDKKGTEEKREMITVGKNIQRLTLQVFYYTCAKWESIALSGFADTGRKNSTAKRTWTPSSIAGN